MPLTNPRGFLIKCDWIEPSVPRRRANLYLTYFLFLHPFLFSPKHGVCGGVGERRPVWLFTVSNKRTILPMETAFGTWKHPNKMENFHSISHAANQRALTQITSAILMMATMKDLFSPHALLLIRLIWREIKWILTKCKRGGVQGGLEELVWQKVWGWDYKKVSGVKRLLWCGIAYNYRWNEIARLEVPPK